MKSEGVLKVTNKELKKLRVIEQVIEKKIKQKTAAKVLGLSVRQIIRLAKRVRREGAKGIVHLLRGRESNRRHDERLRERAIKLCASKYEGFGPTLAQEKLEELDKLYVNRETLRQWMLKESLWEQQRKGQKHREWRERRACFGEMTQADGSHHDWLEGRGPWLVLMGYIDDAASEVYARFYDYEGTMPAMESFYGYTKKYGLPQSLYLDRLKAYCGHGKLTLEEELAGKEKTQSQFERALEELGVEVIHAQSAPAKGRVERLFKTFQDRLVKEMRLAGVKTKEEANQFLEKYLPVYNRRFGVKAREEANLHRPGPGEKELKQILSIQSKPVLRNDNTIRYENKFYQILNQWKGARPEQVVIQKRMDGKLYLVHAGKNLAYREIQEPAKRVQTAPRKMLVKIKPSIPVMSHPWKGPSFRRMQVEKVKVAA